MTIDNVLDEMRGIVPDPRLEIMEDGVLAEACARRERSHSRRNLVVTGVLALSAGLFAGVVPPLGAQAEPLPSFNAPPAIAPSSLLAGMR